MNQHYPTRSLQENLITALAYSAEGGKAIADKLNPDLFEGEYRIVVERLLKYWKKYGKPPRGHTADLFDDKLDEGAKSRKTYERILRNMDLWSSEMDVEVIEDQWLEFVEQQRLRGAVIQSAEALEAGRNQVGTAAKVKEAFLEQLEEIEASAEQKLTSVTADKFEARKISWVWWPFIPDNTVTVIYGDGGKGKSTITLDIAARITTGSGWPEVDDGDYDKESAPKGSVVILSAEEGPHEVIRPKLAAAGANLSKIHFPGYTKDRDTSKGFERIDRIDKHLKDLDALVEEIGDVRLIVIDPVMSYLGDVDGHNDAKARGLIGALVDLAERHKLAVILVLHLNKKSDLPAHQRAMGSAAFINVPRSAIVVADNPLDPSSKVMVLAKRNLVRSDVNFAIGFATKLIRGDVVVKWDSEWLELSADDVLNRPARKASETKTVKAEALLRELLADGPVSQHDVVAKAAKADIGERTVMKVKSTIGVQSHKEGKAWWWRLPKNSARG